jgi:polyphosphate kinase
MNRNIYRRIEVCFPVYNDNIKAEVLQLIDFQLKDNTQAVALDDELRNIKIKPVPPMVQSQKAIYEFLKSKLND